MSTSLFKAALCNAALFACVLPIITTAQNAPNDRVRAPQAARIRVDDERARFAGQRARQLQSLDEQPSQFERTADEQPAPANKHSAPHRHANAHVMTQASEPHGNAYGVGLEGNTSWKEQQGTLTIHVDRVVNHGSGITGSLRIRLWATNSAYSGGTITGYVLGAFQFTHQLGPNQYFSDVTQQVAFSAPPPATYYTTLTLEEYTGSGWYIRDYVTYSSTSNFGGGGGSSAVRLQGSTSWEIRDGVVTLRANRVINNGTAMTGSLRLELWATNSVYGGGTIRGYVLGSYQFTRQLAPDEYFYNVAETSTVSLPPDGTYHTTMTLEEYTSSGWVIRDYVTYNSTTTFGNPNHNDPCSPRSIDTNGGPAYGALTTSSCVEDGYSLDVYKFYAVAGSQVTIVMQSPDFYTFQLLFGPDGGEAIAYVAEGIDDGRTVATITVPTSGYYMVLATSVDPVNGGPGGLGGYTLQVWVN